MAVLGKGDAHGACSLLHAAGLGYGASVALDLPVTVRLLDKPSKRGAPDDPDGLLQAVLDTWTQHGMAVPGGAKPDRLHWRVDASVPMRQGLKSSSATAVAALRALCDASDTALEEAELVELAVTAQIQAGVTITGSVGDTWATATPGWKLVDAQAPVREGVLLEGHMPDSDAWDVALVLRGQREARPTLEQFQPHVTSFQQALQSLQEGNLLMAMTWNGRGVAAALGDVEGRKMANDAFMNTARAAFITGSGPALAIVLPKNQPQALTRIQRWFESRYENIEFLLTSFLEPSSDASTT